MSVRPEPPTSSPDFEFRWRAFLPFRLTAVGQKTNIGLRQANAAIQRVSVGRVAPWHDELS